jgi:tetratricopeptide (TPR) repeat protein
MKYSVVVLTILVLSLWSCDSKTNSDNTVVIKDTTQVSIVNDSLKFLTDNIQTNSSNSKPWFDRANYFLRRGGIKDALIDMKSAVRLDTNNVIYLNKYADLLVTTLDIEKALTNYGKALFIDSSNTKAYIGMARVYALVNNPGMATGYLQKAYKIDPHLSEAYFLEGMIYRSDFEETGREESIKRALSSFQTAVEQNPNYYSAYIQMGVINHKLQNDIALDYFNTAIAIEPKSTEAWYNKGKYFQDKQMLEEAKYCYRTISEIDSLYSEAYYNQGYIKMIFENDLDSAIYFFNYTIQVDSLHLYAYNNLGLSLERNGEIEKAKTAYRSAIEINPDFKLAKNNLNIISK